MQIPSKSFHLLRISQAICIYGSENTISLTDLVTEGHVSARRGVMFDLV